MPSSIDPGTIARTAPVPKTSKSPAMAHPLDPLSAVEMDLARDIILKARQQGAMFFRAIFAEEPPKADLVKYLQAEHAGDVSKVARPSRQARAQYDLINADKT